MRLTDFRIMATKTIVSPVSRKRRPSAAHPAKARGVDAKVAKRPVRARAPPERDSITMPEMDFALIAALKTTALEAQRAAKKSELLRAGPHDLTALDSKALVAAVDQLDPAQTGRHREATEPSCCPSGSDLATTCGRSSLKHHSMAENNLTWWSFLGAVSMPNVMARTASASWLQRGHTVLDPVTRRSMRLQRLLSAAHETGVRRQLRSSPGSHSCGGLRGRWRRSSRGSRAWQRRSPASA